MVFPFIPFLKAAAPIIGGAIASKSQSRTDEANIAADAERAQQERQWALDDYARQRADGLEDTRLQFQRLREAAEWAGFNPLTVLCANPSGGMINSAPIRATCAGSYMRQGSTHMGAAIADAGALMADAMAKAENDEAGAEIEALRQQNETLRERITNDTLRPRISGVFNRGGMEWPNGQNLGVGVDNRDRPDLSFGNHRPLTTNSPVDPRRVVENKPVSSSSGFMEIDNPYLPVPLRVPTLDGDEPLQWYDYPSLIAPGVIAAGELAYTAGRHVGNMRARERWLRQYQPNYASGAGYLPSWKSGFDALTNSTFPAARIHQ